MKAASKASDKLEDGEDIQALAKGGRTNFFGFLLRLAARIPFLIIAGRWYGADALGRFGTVSASTRGGWSPCAATMPGQRA